MHVSRVTVGWDKLIVCIGRPSVAYAIGFLGVIVYATIAIAMGLGVGVQGKKNWRLATSMLTSGTIIVSTASTLVYLVVSNIAITWRVTGKLPAHDKQAHREWAQRVVHSMLISCVTVYVAYWLADQTARHYINWQHPRPDLLRDRSGHCPGLHEQCDQHRSRRR